MWDLKSNDIKGENYYLNLKKNWEVGIESKEIMKNKKKKKYTVFYYSGFFGQKLFSLI